jgi:hypothetical protein
MKARRLMHAPSAKDRNLPHRPGKSRVVHDSKSCRPMSQLGHSRHFRGRLGFAECPLCPQSRPNLCVATNRRFGPGGDLSRCSNVQTKLRLFDHFVGAAEQRDRKGKTKHLGCIEIDYQFDFRGSLDR